MFSFWVAFGISSFFILLFVVFRVIKIRVFFVNSLLILLFSFLIQYFNIQPYLVLGGFFISSFLLGILINSTGQQNKKEDDEFNIINYKTLVEEVEVKSDWEHENTNKINSHYQDDENFTGNEKPIKNIEMQVFTNEKNYELRQTEENNTNQRIAEQFYMNSETEEQLRKYLEVEMKNKVDEQLRKYLEVEMKSKVEEQFRKYLEIEMKKKAEEQLRRSLETEIKNKVEEQLRRELEAEIKSKVKKDLEIELKNKEAAEKERQALKENSIKQDIDHISSVIKALRDKHFHMEYEEQKRVEDKKSNTTKSSDN